MAEGGHRGPCLCSRSTDSLLGAMITRGVALEEISAPGLNVRKPTDGQLTCFRLLAFRRIACVLRPTQRFHSPQVLRKGSEKLQLLGKKTRCDPIAYFTASLVGFTGRFGFIETPFTREKAYVNNISGGTQVSIWNASRVLGSGESAVPDGFMVPETIPLQEDEGYIGRTNFTCWKYEHPSSGTFPLWRQRMQLRERGIALAPTRRAFLHGCFPSYRDRQGALTLRACGVCAILPFAYTFAPELPNSIGVPSHPERWQGAGLYLPFWGAR